MMEPAPDIRTYFVRDKTGERGPFTLHQCRSMWNSGHITADAQLRARDDDQWKEAAPIIEVSEPSHASVVSKVEKALDLTPSDRLRGQVALALEKQGEIFAIKQHRVLTGSDLETAKRLVAEIQKGQVAKTTVGNSREEDSGIPTPRESETLKKDIERNPGQIGILAIVVLIMGGCVFKALYSEPPPPPPPLTAIEEKYGRAPIKKAGGYREVKDYLMKTVRDPSSLEIITFYEAQPITAFGIDGWGIRVTYRAKNGFGGYSVEDGVALVREGQVRHWKSERN